MRDWSSRRRKRSERGNVHEIWKGNMESCKPALKVQLLTNLWLLAGGAGGEERLRRDGVGVWG